MMGKKIRVLIADDSQLIYTLLNSIFSRELDFEVVGFARNGEEAIQMTRDLKPNLVTMDIMMPKVNGYEATRRIMAECPTPIIILSSLIHEEEVDSAVQALSAGALEALPKFFDLNENDFEAKRKQLLSTARALSEVRVIRRRTVTLEKAQRSAIKLIGLGLSTGGPQALVHILSSLDASFSVPIVVVLHISKGFLTGLVKWLKRVSKLEVRIAEHGERLLPGCVYFAPDDYHLLIRDVGYPMVALTDGQSDDLFTPAVDKFFHSLAMTYPGTSVGGILTGMGRDGALGLRAMKDAGCFTFAETSESSIVSGMPDAARKQGAVEKSVSLEEIPSLLERAVKKEGGK